MLTRPSLIAVIAALLLSAFARGNSAPAETHATLRQYVLELINRDRIASGLAPVQLDLHASEVGDTYCRAQIANGTTGHFTTDGLAPYMRYSFAGGNDAVSENAAAWSAGYRFTARALYEMARRSQEAMMAEKPPDDGHRRAILDPNATHVGIGLAWEGGEFRIVHEFVRRHIAWKGAVPRRVALGQQVTLRGRPLRGALEGITIHYEREPAAIAARVASSIDRYALPADRVEYRPRVMRPPTDAGARVTSRLRLPGASERTFAVGYDGSFAFAVPFDRGPGIYTVAVWLSRDGGESFTASTLSLRVADAKQSGPAAGVLAR